MLHAQLRLYRGLRILVLFACVAFASTQAVHAQGTDGMFPPPISTPELAEYFLRLSASPEQQQAIMRMHDRYQAEFRRLREGDLQRVMDRMAALQQPLMPDPKQIVELAQAMKTGEQQIVRVDNRFFDELQGVLSPAQNARMARLRQARERMRSVSGSAGMMMFAGLEGLELESILRKRDIDPTAPGNEAIDAILETYERRLTSELGKLAEQAGSFMFDIVEVLEAAGIAPGTNLMEDPEQMTQLMEASQKFMMERMTTQQRMVRELRDLAMTAGRQIGSMLDPVDGAGIRRAITGEIYNEIGWGFVAHGGFNDFLWNAERMAMKMDDAPGQRVRNMIADIGPRIDRMISQAVEIIDERDASTNMFEFDADLMQQYHERINVLRTEAQEYLQQLAALLDELDKESGATTMWRLRMLGKDGDADLLPMAEVDAAAAEEAEVAQRWTADWSVPTRMGQEDVRHLRLLLSLDEGEMSVVSQLHSDYVEAYRGLDSIAQVRSLSQRLWGPDPNSGEAQLDANGLRTLLTARRGAVDDVLAAEAEFFDSVEVMVGTAERAPLIKAAHQARRLFVYMRSPHLWFAPAQQEDQEWQVNAMRLLLRDREIASADRTTGALAFAARADALIEAARKQFDAGLEAQYLQERWQIDQREGGGDFSSFTERQREISAHVSTMSAARLGMAETNRSLLEEICTAVGDAAAERMRSQYNRTAFPNVFAAGVLDVEPFLRRALELPDLSGGQREQVLELLATFRPGFDRYSQEMVAVVRRMSAQQAAATAAPSGEDMSEWQAYAEFNREIERMRHDRSELTYRTLLELRAALSESQLAAVGPMPNLAELVGQ